MIQVDRARALAQIAHAGQKYGEEDYFEAHISEVARRVEKATKHVYGSDHVIVAYLHDIVEDTAVTLDHLVDFGFGPEIVKSVDALTRRTGEEYFDYIERVKADDRFAPFVKCCDLEANINRNTKPSLIERNKKALDILHHAMTW